MRSWPGLADERRDLLGGGQVRLYQYAHLEV